MRIRATALHTALFTLTATALAWGAAPFAQAAAPARAGSSFGCAAAPAAGHARCFGLFRPHRTSDGTLLPRTTGSPSTVGWTPTDLRSAYNLAGTSGAGRTVAIVDAYDDPKAESDLVA